MVAPSGSETGAISTPPGASRSDFEVNDFAGVQARFIGDRQGCLVLEATRRIDQASHLFDTRVRKRLSVRY